MMIIKMKYQEYLHYFFKKLYKLKTLMPYYTKKGTKDAANRERELARLKNI
jgi:hypothetical protein